MQILPFTDKGMSLRSIKFFKWLTFLTCMVKCEEKQKHSHEHITQKGDNSTAYSFWNRVDCLHKELKEYWYAAVEEYTQQNAGCVQCSYDRNKNSY